MKLIRITLKALSLPNGLLKALKAVGQNWFPVDDQMIMIMNIDHRCCVSTERGGCSTLGNAPNGRQPAV